MLENKQRKVTKESIINFHLLRRHFSKMWWYMPDSQLLGSEAGKLLETQGILPTKQIPEQLGLDSETLPENKTKPNQKTLDSC